MCQRYLPTKCHTSPYCRGAIQGYEYAYCGKPLPPVQVKDTKPSAAQREHAQRKADAVAAIARAQEKFKAAKAAEMAVEKGPKDWES